jgi:hypothetical protein
VTRVTIWTRSDTNNHAPRCTPVARGDSSVARADLEAKRKPDPVRGLRFEGLRLGKFAALEGTNGTSCSILRADW